MLSYTPNIKGLTSVATQLAYSTLLLILEQAYTSCSADHQENK